MKSIPSLLFNPTSLCRSRKAKRSIFAAGHLVIHKHMKTQITFGKVLSIAVGTLFMAKVALVAAIPYATDFETFNPGAVNGQESWSQSYGDSALAIISDTDGGAFSGAQYLQLSSNASAGTRVIAGDIKGDINGYQDLTYYLRASLTGTGSGTAFTARVNYNAGALNFTVYFAYNGAVALYDGGTLIQSGFNLTADRWYRIDTSLSDDGESVSFQLMDAEDESVKISLNNLKFTADTTGGKALSYHDVRFETLKNSGYWNIDNVATAIPEPSAISMAGVAFGITCLLLRKRR